MGSEWLDELWRLGTKLGTTLDLDHEIEIFKEEIVRVISPRLLLVFLSDEGKDLLHLKASHGVEGELETKAPMGKDLPRWLRSQGIDLPEEGDPRFYAVPMTIENQILGVVCVLSSLPPDETEGLRREVEFVKSAVNYLSPIVRNVQRYERRIAEVELYLDLLADFSSRLSSQEGVESIIDRIVIESPRMVGVGRCMLLTVSEDGEYLMLRASNEDLSKYGDITSVKIPIKGKLKEVLESKKPIVLKGLQDIPKGGEAHRRLRIKTALVLPILADDEPIGLMTFDSPGEEMEFDRDDEIFARIISLVVTLALYRVRVIEKIRQEHQEELRLMRLKSLGEMASGVVHDLNNALSGVVGYIQLLKARVDDPELRRFAEIAERSAKDTVAIVQRMRAFYKEQESARVTLDLNRLIGDVIEMTKPRWKNMPEAKGIQIEIVTDFESIPMIEGQESELRQLFTNLIFNAVDAMPDGGKIAIKTRRRGRYAIVEVSDTGVGMDEETKSRIFEPFFTTKPEGSGLGLSICRRIVAEHGGSIEVESVPGKGTTFTVTLPIAEAYLKAEAGETEGRPISPKRVLIVDDEKVVRQVITDMLSELGHESVTAENGLEGLETFRKERFDLVLVDLGMPGMNGLQLARLMRSIDDQTPIVLLTGWGDTIDEEEVGRHGIWKVISKPVRMEELRDLIASLSRQNGSDG